MMAARLLLCDCAGTQRLDREAIGAATGRVCSRVHTALCTGEIGDAGRALGDAGEEGVIFACGQEAETFQALADGIGAPAPLAVDIRDRAGWSADEADKTPKIAALLALAETPAPPRKTMDVSSDGTCLVLGESEVALPVAEQLAEALSVTCVTSDAPAQIPGPVRRFDAHQGRLRAATGAIGRFEVMFDGFAAAAPAGRGAVGVGPPRDGAKSTCDLILDLRGGQPLFPAHEKRDGYFRADPGDPRAVAKAAFDVSHMVGVFEKTLHIAFDESLCAHSRAGQTGCTRCLDLCPTGAIAPDGDTVRIDPHICAGCGACVSACPSGAAASGETPAAHTFARLRAAASAYRKTASGAPRLLVHDAAHGGEMISLAARFGRGLPADAIPLDMEALAVFGHAEMLVALASGFSEVALLLGPRADRAAIEAEAALAAAMAPEGDARIRLLEPTDPDALSDLMFADAPAPLAAEPILPLGGRREAARLAAKSLSGSEGALPLPAGAPYGAVLVDKDACTLCLACASLCPPGALTDNPDAPQLRFREDACLQCGLCASVCPEDAITLEPRINLADSALSEIVLNEEAPAACVECGALFGVQSTIDRIVAKLEGLHPMFTNSDNARLIRMCDKCRVEAQYHSDAAPFSGGARPPTRTAADYRDEET